MSQECDAVIRAIYLLQGRHLHSSTTYQLKRTREQLERAYSFLAKLEEDFPENTISTQLGALFQQAHDGFSEICTHMDQRYTIKMTKALKIIKLNNIAERLEAASKPSISTREMISEVLKILEPKNIGERINASKPSTSSSQITTMEMVRFVAFLLDYVKDYGHVKLRYLHAFFILTASRCIEHESMQYFFIHIENVTYTALRLHFQRIDEYGDLEYELHSLMNSFSPDLRQIYKNLLTALKSSRSETTLKSGCMLDFVNALREDLELHPRLVGIRSLKEGLLNISKFLLEYRCTQLRIFSSLQSLIEALAFEAALMINSYDEDLLFALQPKLNHVNVVIELIQLRNSQETFLLRADTLQLIDYALEELIVVTTFLMDSLEQCKQQPKITDLLTLIQSVTNEACSAVKNLLRYARQEDLVWEMNRSHFQLLLKFNFIKAAIRQMCSTISASSTEIHLLNFLPINFEVIDSYLLSSSCHDNMDLVMMGFHEYIIDNLLLKDETDLSFTVADDVKKFYDGLLLLLTYLLDPLSQSSGFGTIAIEAESVNSNKSNLVLQFLTVAFKLIECERSLMDLQKHKATLEAHILDMIESTHEKLICLRVLLIGVLRQQTVLYEFHNVLMHADVTANKIAQIIEGRSIEEIGLLLSEIESVKVEVRKVCFQFLDASPYNMTDGEGLIRFLSKHQDWLLNFDACSIPFLKNQIPVIKDKLFYLGSFIADIVQRRDMHQELKDLVKHVQDIKFVSLSHQG
ncbi:hypothetical protein MTR67_022212 [Solanum verrucosum]|uniref:Uncharacterized protein n=1 Tax=Solanum verrucosum TaxID=315347 RepID=A0AAF0QRG6_SOLVR|nr:hypothetical protein MTR67_022212 [Solanum verrucosum]